MSKRRFVEALTQLGATLDGAQAVVDDILRRYQEPGRHYHNADHLQQVALNLDLLLHQPSPQLIIAAWYHDAVYDSRRNDNEEASADLARDQLQDLGVAADQVARVEELVMATKSHVAIDVEAKVLVDADLAILGSEHGEYKRYSEAIRKEYAWVPEDQYRTRRADVLRRFLERESIYQTEIGKSNWELRARQNMRKELLQLTKN